MLNDVQKHILQIVADMAGENAQLVGQLPALGDQFKGGGHHHALALLAENPYVFEGSGISTIKSHFLISFLR